MTGQHKTGQDKDRQRVVFVSGPSGAGRSTAIDALEDIGFEAIDNLPLSLIPRLLDGPPLTRPLALGLDVRNRDFSVAQMLEVLGTVTAHEGLDAELLFLECQEDVLVRRYSETRRRHPMAEGLTPVEAIRVEASLLGPLRERAHVLIDTSQMSPHDLRAEIDSAFGTVHGRFLGLSILSFSYKRGMPRGVDTAFDCRFLRNPHWQADLKPLDGRAEAVSDYVAQDPLYAPFLGHVTDLCTLLLPAYKDEGKSHLTIAFGCTGGQHRSVAVAEAVSATLSRQGWWVSVRHRELERRNAGN